MNRKLLLLIIVASFCVITCTVTANADMAKSANVHTYIIKGIEFYKSGNYDQAIKCYDMAIALEPETETAETAWAGKELAFYKQGKNEDALCCYYRLKNIDCDTNLIERRKNELINSISDSAIAPTIFDLGFAEQALGSLAKKKVVVEIGTYMVKRETSAGIGMVLAPEITGPALLLLTIYDVYTNRNEIENAINEVFSETNSTTIVQ